MRTLLAILVAAFAAGVASLIVGEYGVAGWVTLFVGVVAGLVIGEIAASVARSRDWALALVSGALAGAGVLWGAWLDSGRGVAPLGIEAVLAPALAAAVTIYTVRTYRRPTPPELGEARANEGDPA